MGGFYEYALISAFLGRICTSNLSLLFVVQFPDILCHYISPFTFGLSVEMQVMLTRSEQ
jgi:hypothetical protein